MESIPLNLFAERLELVASTEAHTASNREHIHPENELSLPLVIEEQSHEIQKLRQKLDATKFDDKIRSYNLKSELFSNQQLRNLSQELSEKQSKNNKLANKIRSIENELKDQRDYSYHRELDLKQQIETLKDIIKSKESRLKAMESIMISPSSTDISHLTPTERLTMEIKLYKHKIDSQDICIKRLNGQLENALAKLALQPKTIVLEAEKVNSFCQTSEIFDNNLTEFQNDDNFISKNHKSKSKPIVKKTKKIKPVIEQIHSVTLELTEFLNIVSPEMASKIRCNSASESARLKFISLSYAEISKRAKQAVLEIQKLNEERDKLQNDLLEGKKALCDVMRKIKKLQKQLTKNSECNLNGERKAQTQIKENQEIELRSEELKCPESDSHVNIIPPNEEAKISLDRNSNNYKSLSEEQVDNSCNYKDLNLKARSENNSTPIDLIKSSGIKRNVDVSKNLKLARLAHIKSELTDIGQLVFPE